MTSANDESFSAYLRHLSREAKRLEIEVATGRIVTGRLMGTHSEWILVVDDEKKQNVVAVEHVASVRVLDWKVSAPSPKSRR